jgi:hypothetical protein
MRILTIVILLTLSFQAMACEINPGKIGVEKNGTTYKLFLRGEPKNTCYPNTSTSLRISVLCPDGSFFESHTIGTKDTLVMNIEGQAIIGMSVNWLPGTTRTDIPSIVIGQGPCSIDFVEIATEDEPDISTENPPPFVPEMWTNFGEIEANTGGTLVIVELNTWAVTVKEFSGPFSYQLQTGIWLVYLLLGDGGTIGQQVVEVN